MKTAEQIQDALRWVAAEAERQHDCPCLRCLTEVQLNESAAAALAWALDVTLPNGVDKRAEIDAYLTKLRDSERTARYLHHPKTADTLRVKKQRRRRS